MTPHTHPPTLRYDDHCAEILTQTALLTSALTAADGTEADLTAPVPSCPEWNLGHLLRHLGSAPRWVETIVRTGADQPPLDTALRELPRHTDDGIPALTAWLTEGAEGLAHALRTAGPEARIWTPLPGDAGACTPRFFARRMTHETVIHRADATLATRTHFGVDRRVARDALDEWRELGSLPEMFDHHPERRDLLGAGRTLRFHTTDTPPEAAADWLVDLTGHTLAWRRSPGGSRRHPQRPAHRPPPDHLRPPPRPGPRPGRPLHRSPGRHRAPRLLAEERQLQLGAVVWTRPRPPPDGFAQVQCACYARGAQWSGASVVIVDHCGSYDPWGRPAMTGMGSGIGRRRVLAASGGVALSGALAGVLSACGTNTGRSGGGSGPGISQWYHQYGEPGVQRAVERYAAAYKKADVRVQWRPGDYDRQTAAALLTDSGPDVFEVNGPLLDQIRGGQVVDLTAEVEPVKDDFNQAVLAPKIWQDKIWGIPQTIDTQLLYYRKSLLRDASVEPPRTLDELVDAAKKLTGKKQKGLFLGNDGGVGVLGGTPLFAAGLSLIGQDGKVGFDDPAAARTLGKIRQLYADKSLLLGAPADWSDPSAFIQGLTAIQWSGLWALPQIKKALGDDFGVLPFPKDGADGKPSVPVGAYGSAVSARSGRKAEAKAFAQWLWIERGDYQQDFALSYGFHIPARISLAKKAERLRKGAAADAVRFATDHGYAEPLLWTTADRTAYQDALSRIIKDGANPESELKTVVRKVNAELQRVRKK